MVPTFQIGYGVFIAHILPGVLFLAAIMFDSNNIPVVLRYTEVNTSLSLAICLIASISVGLFIDSVRFVLLQILQYVLNKNYSDQKSDYPVRTQEAIKGTDWVVENHYRFHQFYGNMAIVFLFSSTALTNYKLMSVVACIVSLTASVISFLKTKQALKHIKGVRKNERLAQEKGKKGSKESGEESIAEKEK